MNIPPEVKNHPDFKKNTKKFWGLEQSDTKSEWDRNVNKFFAKDEGGDKVGDKFMNVQTNVQVNPNSETYQRN